MCYISRRIKHERKEELEGTDSNLVIVDIISDNPFRLINVYRNFKPQANKSQREKFKYQLNLIKVAMKKRTIIIGDFNLDYSQKENINYRYANLFNDFEEILTINTLFQIIEFPTWSRIVNNELKESTLDHIYLTDMIKSNHFLHNISEKIQYRAYKFRQ